MNVSLVKLVCVGFLCCNFCMFQRRFRWQDDNVSKSYKPGNCSVNSLQGVDNSLQNKGNEIYVPLWLGNMFRDGINGQKDAEEDINGRKKSKKKVNRELRKVDDEDREFFYSPRTIKRIEREKIEEEGMNKDGIERVFRDQKANISFLKRKGIEGIASLNQENFFRQRFFQGSDAKPKFEVRSNTVEQEDLKSSAAVNDSYSFSPASVSSSPKPELKRSSRVYSGLDELTESEEFSSDSDSDSDATVSLSNIEVGENLQDQLRYIDDVVDMKNEGKKDEMHMSVKLARSVEAKGAARGF